MYIEVFKLIKKSILYILVLSFGVLNACSTNDEENENIAPSNIQLETQQVNNEKDTRPNILVILADDLGYSDIGVFGGEINTCLLYTSDAADE